GQEREMDLRGRRRRGADALEVRPRGRDEVLGFLVEIGRIQPEGPVLHLELAAAIVEAALAEKKRLGAAPERLADDGPLFEGDVDQLSMSTRCRSAAT